MQTSLFSDTKSEGQEPFSGSLHFHVENKENTHKSTKNCRGDGIHCRTNRFARRVTKNPRNGQLSSTRGTQQQELTRMYPLSNQQRAEYGDISRSAPGTLATPGRQSIRILTLRNVHVFGAVWMGNNRTPEADRAVTQSTTGLSSATTTRVFPIDAVSPKSTVAPVEYHKSLPQRGPLRRKTLRRRSSSVNERASKQGVRDGRRAQEGRDKPRCATQA